MFECVSIYSSWSEFIVTKQLDKIKTNIEKFEVKSCEINFVQVISKKKNFIQVKKLLFSIQIYISCILIQCS
jgi:hypothetical protein